MRATPLVLFVLVLACGCGGSSGSSVAAGVPVDVEVPVIGPGEGYIHGGNMSIGFSNLVIGDNATNETFVGIIAFDISGLGDVQDAELVLHQGPTTGMPWDLAPLFVDHIEGGGVIQLSQATDLPLTAEAFTLGDEASWTLDVTPYVAADRAAGRTVTTFRFRLAIPTDGDAASDYARIASSTHALETVRPLLSATHVP